MFINHADRFLDQLIEAVQVSPADTNRNKNYRSLCSWFERDDSTLKEWGPSSYLQGSFRLGTAIKPTTEEDEYDLDIVVELLRGKDQISQAGLKSAVGVEVKSYAKRHGMGQPKNARRCWTQEYAEGSRFHVDTLPAIPDAAGMREFLESRSLHTDYADGAIAITDKTDANFEAIHPNWPASNPADMLAGSRVGWGKSWLRKAAIALAESRSVDDVPTYRAQTPLQKSVQVLKFHRDKMFADDGPDKPISIIITTLAAHAYGGRQIWHWRSIQSFKIWINSLSQGRVSIGWLIPPMDQRTSLTSGSSTPNVEQFQQCGSGQADSRVFQMPLT